MSLDGCASAKRDEEFRLQAASVADALSGFYGSANSSGAAKTAPLLHPIWNAKIIGEDDDVQMISRERFAERAGRNEAIAPDYQISAVDFSHDRMAITRVDDWHARATSMHLLLKDRVDWVHVGMLTAKESIQGADARFSSRTTESAVLDVLQKYYRAVTEGDPLTIDEIFHSCWQMKNHEGDKIVSEDKSAFIGRIEAGAVEGYDADRRISCVKVIADRLAFVRIDRPSTPSTTSFFFVRCGGEWRITDKIWVDGRI